MRVCRALAFACLFGLLVNGPLAASEPLLFEGPPLATRVPSGVELSVYQHEDASPLEVDEFPPAPIPMPEPERAPEIPAEPQIISGVDAESAAAPLPDPFAEPSAEMEIPAAPEVATESPQQEQPPRFTPQLLDGTESDSEESGAPATPLHEPELVPIVDPHAFLYDEPMAGCDSCSTPSCTLHMPCISCANLALPSLPQARCLQEFGLELGGWLEAGFSAVGTSPADRFNGPVTFNDRHAEAQMNQLWFYLERKPNTWSGSLDLGGRIDVTYGTDARYIQADDGLESDWEQSDRFYQMALPQFYLDATLAGWTVRMGRFFTILGYEKPAAPDNFFYSHAYTMQYGEPFTHTGMLVSRRVGQWLLNAGFHRGNDQFNDTDGLNALNVLGGIGYTTHGQWATAEYAFSSTENGPGVLSYTHSLVTTLRMTRKLDCALQGDYGEIWNGARRSKDTWWGLNQYVTYRINPCWSAGARVEWFRDRDGTRVSGIRSGNQTPTGLSGDFYEITLGLNWNPRTNLRVRPEARWDFFDPDDTAVNKAYDAGNLNRQFTFGCDVICKF